MKHNLMNDYNMEVEFLTKRQNIQNNINKIFYFVLGTSILFYFAPSVSCLNSMVMMLLFFIAFVFFTFFRVSQMKLLPNFDQVSSYLLIILTNILKLLLEFDKINSKNSTVY